MQEVWKRKQVHEGARNIYSTNIFVGKCWKVVKATPNKSRFGKKNGRF